MHTSKPPLINFYKNGMLHAKYIKLLRYVFVAGIAATLITSSNAQQSQNKTVKVLDGTIIHVVLTEPLSSAKNHQNDIVHFETADDIKVADTVVVPKGASVIGRISEAEPKKGWGHSGKLAFSVDYVKAVDGTNVRLRASSTHGGQDSKGALMLGLSGAFIHGKDVNIPKGTAIDAYVDGDREITVETAPQDNTAKRDIK